jgi:serine/threonine-protein kinase
MKKNYTISIPAVSFWKVLVPTILVCGFVGGLISLLVVDKIVMPGIVHVNRGMISVPVIEGLPTADAQQALYDVGLRMQVETSRYDEKILRDCIISQEPPSGESVKKGRLIMVVVSKGSKTGEVPDLRNQPERKALLELKRQGFTIGNVRRIYSTDYPKDAIMEMIPPQGTVISKDKPIDIIICTGEDPGAVVVPDLSGETLADAQQKLEAAGLKLGSVDYTDNAQQVAGTVVTQSIAPTASVARATTVNLVIAVAN